MRFAPKTRNPFSFLFASSRREQYVARYVIRECGRGRALDEVLDDPYVRNRISPEEQGRLLEHPEVVAAIGEQTIAEMRRTLAPEPPVGAGHA